VPSLAITVFSWLLATGWVVTNFMVEGKKINSQQDQCSQFDVCQRLNAFDLATIATGLTLIALQNHTLNTE